MKIFATSDIHGNHTIIDKLERVSSHADLVIVCGDIGGKEHFQGRKSFKDAIAGQEKDALLTIDRLRRLPVPVRFILGNDDWFDYSGEGYLKTPERISGFDLVPFEYVLVTPFNTNREANDNKIRYELGKINAGEKTVVVAHTPPHRCGDTLYDGTHVGSRAASQWISDVQPMIWLCGHIHEDHSVNNIGRTLIFNCACDHLHDELRGWIVDLDTLEYENVRM